MASFVRKCSNCSSPYCSQIDTKFNVWVLMTNRDNLKIQLPEIGGDPYMAIAIAIEDVRREVNILRALIEHKNLVQFYEAREDDDNVYIVMD